MYTFNIVKDPLVKTVYFSNTRVLIEALIDSSVTRGNYVNYKTIQLICKAEGISPIVLVKPKVISSYNGKQGPSVQYTIYPKLFF